MTFLSLYRKYRPRNFKDLVGQRPVVKTLQNALKHNRVAHAYLFAGPRGTGKTSTAKVFAQALNCPDREGVEPCGRCENCRRIQSGQSIDVIEIDAASNRGIDEIRDLREKVKFYPGEGAYKVYIIDEVHMLTKGAFNALLKTLEEPPDNVVFILATTEPHRVIDTILSRCQRYDFSLLSLEDIKGRLEYICRQEEADYEEEALNIITRSSNGGMRDAISLLDQAISYTNGSITAEEIQQMLGKVAQEELNLFFDWIIENKAVKALELVNRLIERGNSISVFVADLIEHTRRLLLVKECGTNSRMLNYPAEILADLQKEAGKTGTARLFRMLEILTDIERKLTFSDQPRLVLELGVMKMADPAADSTLEGLQARIAALEEKLSRLGAGGISASPAAGRGESAAKSESETESESEIKAESGTEAKSESETESASEPQSGIEAESKIQSGTGAESETSGTGTGAESKTESGTGTGMKAESETAGEKPGEKAPAAGQGTGSAAAPEEDEKSSAYSKGAGSAAAPEEDEKSSAYSKGAGESAAAPEEDEKSSADSKGAGESAAASEEIIEKTTLSEEGGETNNSKIQELWPEVLARIKDENISVQAYLLEGRPVMMKGELLTIEFPPDKGFHRKGAEKEQGLIRKVISRLLGQPCQLEFFTPGEDKGGKSKKKARSDESDENKGKGMIEEIIKLFDGKIIKVDYSVLGESETSQDKT